MKTKFLFSLFLLVFFLGCSGYEFTYSKDPKIKEVEKKVVFVVAGNDTTLAKIKLIETFGRSENDPIFFLNVDITKTNTPIVIEKDATVSKSEIEHSIKYSFGKLESGCEIFAKNISTKSTYSSSSSGYSFSTDLSEEKIIVNNLVQNIDELLDYIISFQEPLDC